MLSLPETIKARYLELDKALTDPKILGDREKFQKISKEYTELSKLMGVYHEYQRIYREIEENQELLSEADEELRELAYSEIDDLRKRQLSLERELKALLLPKDPSDEKNIFLEIRGGTGGGEAALFASELFRMYCRYAEFNKWRVEIASQNLTGLGGAKEIIALIEGKGAYRKLKYESGVHRVQRVPATESQGRIHTSTVTVAILPEAGEVEVEINPNDLRIDSFRSSGHGGQSVNKTDSAVRITHLPTGLVVTCQDEKSQHQNKAKALRVLRSRLLDKLNKEKQLEISQDRKRQVGSAERSEKIRTYNFSQGRFTDHRIGLTLYRLEEILDGNLDEIIEALITHYEDKVKAVEGKIQ